MAEVVTQPAPVEQTRGAIGSFFNFMSAAWPYFLIAFIVVLLAVVIYYLLQKLEEEKRFRDEPGYQVYKQTLQAAIQNADHDKIRKTWSPKYLFWLLCLPLFWLAFILKEEHSRRIIDINNHLIGFYRGELKMMDGTQVYVAYKTKTFFFFEDLFCIKYPRSIKLDEPTFDEQGDIVLDSRTKKAKMKTTLYDLTDRLRLQPNGDMQLLATGIEKVGLYYYCPDLIFDAKLSSLDLRKWIEGAITDNTYQLMVTRLQNIGAKQMEAMAMWNPQVQAARKMPEKTKEEIQQEGDGGFLPQR